MSETQLCPDCGQPNAPGSEMCASCHFPLTAPEPPAERPAAGPPPPPRAPSPRPMRPRRPRPQSNVALSLWLGFGTFGALVLVLVAFSGYQQSNFTPVEGSNQDQQKQSDAMRAALAADSTNVQARVALADILFDTGNWADAIVHYRSAVRQDSSRIPAIVDLGVCYYNLGDPDEAERHFRLALARDPHHPFALFNLGIVHERRSQPDKALEYFHRALESDPPENMKMPLVEAMQRVVKQTGKNAPPLRGGK
jgi:cytochrome c-type biogenesis protein CcmH/NrfG